MPFAMSPDIVLDGSPQMIGAFVSGDVVFASIVAALSLSFFALMLNRLHFLSICEQTDAGNPGENQFPWL